jgi:GNAT superfamily N-acetyltransferase
MSAVVPPALSPSVTDVTDATPAAASAGITIARLDFTNPPHQQDFIALLDHYAHDPMGGGTGLSDFARAELWQRLRDFSGFVGWIAYQEGRAVGLVNCFLGFSTFAAKPLLNIHDIVVHRDCRGQGLSHRLLAAVEAHARDTGCCKLTLEVLEGNAVARSSYLRFGFAGYELKPEAGKALFMEKKLG